LAVDVANKDDTLRAVPAYLQRTEQSHIIKVSETHSEREHPQRATCNARIAKSPEILDRISDIINSKKGGVNNATGPAARGYV
jgi:hypothetical protein